MADHEHILHPEIFARTPIFGERLATMVEERAADVARAAVDLEDSDISVLIRTRNDRQMLETLFQDLDKQEYDGNIQTIVVDTESHDGTTDVARHFGALVVPISQDTFNYAASLNRGFKVADNPYVATLVGHSNLATSVALRGLTRWYGSSDFGGLYGILIPGANASLAERYVAAKKNLLGAPHLPEGREITHDRIGLMTANDSVICKEAWSEVGGYDEAYGGGGEDRALGLTFLAAGIRIFHEPAFSAHHSHGLGPLNIRHQNAYWRQLGDAKASGEPATFDPEALRRYRRDLDL